MYRVKLRIEGVPPEVGPQAASDIAEGFKERPWHDTAICTYDEGGLMFISENDFDFNGLVTVDELSDEFSANVRMTWEHDGNLRIVSVEEF